MRWPSAHMLRLVLWSGALLGTLVILVAFRDIFLPLVLGFGIAYLLDPAVGWFERRGWSRRLGVIITTLLLVAGLGILLLYIIPTIAEQFHRLRERLPAYQQGLEDLLAPWLARVQARYPGQIEALSQRALDAARENLPQLAGSIGALIGNLFSNLLSLLLFLLNLIFVPVFVFYLLLDFPKLKNSARKLIPLPYRDVVLARCEEIDQVVASFLRGQFSIALILAAINGIGLMLLDVPLGLVIAVAGGLANLVPYMALVVGLAPALMLSWVEHQNLARLLGVVAVFSGAQLLEGMYLSPRILGKSMNLHPIWVLLAVIVGGSLFGFFGMLLAVPAAGTLHVLVHHWVETYQGSRVYQGEVVGRERV